jgi:ABC-type transport system involved in cytochrome bd biosynthesis fused ATPase/permease subunit
MVWGFEFDSCVVRGSGRQAVVKKKIEVERGSITILSGSSGSGKSLILEALCGLRPARWSGLRLQDALGNVAEPFAESFVSKDLFSYVESNPFIFQGSIRENLTLGNSQRLSDATLWQHLEVVGLLPRIKAMGDCMPPYRAGWRISAKANVFAWH